ncbi:MAG: hypothetical protein GY754_38035 [bacterium]|nr:hypothetical protein [bacterium]
MTKKSKLILVFSIIGGIALVILLGWMSCSYLLSQFAPELNEMAVKTDKEVDAFLTAKTTSEDCVNEAFARSGKDSSFSKLVEQRIFAKRCLASAIPVKETCSGVYSGDSMIESIMWAVDYCKEKGLTGDQGCNSIAQEILEHCKRQDQGTR